MHSFLLELYSIKVTQVDIFLSFYWFDHALSVWTCGKPFCEDREPKIVDSFEVANAEKIKDVGVLVLCVNSLRGEMLRPALTLAL